MSARPTLPCGAISKSHRPVNPPITTPSRGRVAKIQPIASPAVKIRRSAPRLRSPALSNSHQASNIRNSVNVWVISDADIARSQGDAPIIIATRSA